MTVVRADARASRRGAAENFTGEVFQDEVLVGQAPSRMRATVVSFTPGARTGWHSHPVGQTLHCLSGVGRICIGKGSPAGDLSRRHSDDPAQYDALARRRPGPPVRPSGDVGKWRAGPGHNLGRARQRQRLQDGTCHRLMQAAQPSAPAARSAAISAGSSQPASVASASSPRFGGWGGIGRSGTVRLNRGAGAGCAIPSIST